MASLVRVPTEVVKQRLQTGEYKSAINAVSGWCLSLCCVLWFVSTEVVKQRLQTGEYKSAINAVSGRCLYLCCDLIRVPTEVVKQRLQTGEAHLLIHTHTLKTKQNALLMVTGAIHPLQRRRQARHVRWLWCLHAT